MLVCLAVGISLIASFRFNRFNPDYGFHEGSEVSQDRSVNVREIDDHENMFIKETRLMRLDEDSYGFQLLPMLFAELKLALNELNVPPVYSFIGVILMIITGFILPLDIAKNLFLPIVWVLPVFIWSKFGSRETQHQTDQLVFSSVNPILRQLSALWLSGVLVSFLSGGGVALNLVFHGDWVGVFSWFVGALFIPSFALFLGVWTGSGKVFEFLYFLLWYLGPINGLAPLDFIGVSSGNMQSGFWRLYLIFTVFLVSTTILGRKIHIQKN